MKNKLIYKFVKHSSLFPVPSLYTVSHPSGSAARCHPFVRLLKSHDIEQTLGENANNCHRKLLIIKILSFSLKCNVSKPSLDHNKLKNNFFINLDIRAPFFLAHTSNVISRH